jgi:hypothetical protein
VVFFISFLKIEYDKGPNFVAEFEQKGKNCSNSTRKAGLEISLAAVRLDREPNSNEGNP